MKFKFLNSYNRKLLLYFILIFSLFSVGVGIFQYQREKQYRAEQLETTLNTYNHILYSYLKTHTDSIALASEQVKLFPDSNLRITIIDKKGTVLYDSFVKAYHKLENHIDRPEIKKAIATGTHGSKIRFSESTKQDFYYYAFNYKEYFLRTALPYNLEVKELLSSDYIFVYFVILLFLISSIVLVIISDKMGQAISNLEEFARKAGNNETINTHLQFPKNELGTIGEQIVSIYKSLQKTKNALSNEKEKLFKHLHTSQEGLAIFSNLKKEILANNHFIQYANIIADQQIVWSDEVFNLSEFSPILEFINKELSKENHLQDGAVRKEMNIEKNSRFFQIYCIIFQDQSFEISITDTTLIEREKLVKKELTSNISHELKTPVSSIRGYLETIVLNKNLDADKVKFFIERSYAQTQRLTDLINDITSLNKIEETSSGFTTEAINLRELVSNITLDVHLNLKEKDINYQNLIAETLMIQGDRSLIYSIFRNLTDNAIAYAGEHISIVVNCYREDEMFYYFSFYDTGSGVSESHLDRIFERFYRVDSGRSRKLGGTGLGLSIVKNAVLLHGGQISVKNRSEGGLEFLFSFRKTTDNIIQRIKEA